MVAGTTVAPVVQEMAININKCKSMLSFVLAFTQLAFTQLVLKLVVCGLVEGCRHVIG